MKTVRYNTFETNSSSAHALIYTSKKNFEMFEKGDMVLHMGGFGVPDSYLKGRGWKSNGGQDGKLLSWSDARDLYVEYLKSEGRKHWQKYINFLNWHARKGIHKPDDITVDDFKKGVAWGEQRRDGYGDLVFGTWFNYNEWKKSRCDEYGDPIESKAEEADTDNICMDFWWFAG